MVKVILSFLLFIANNGICLNILIIYVNVFNTNIILFIYTF